MRPANLINFFLAALLALMLIKPSELEAQDLSQVIKGRVVDRETGNPLSGANVTVSCQENLRGANTDSDGGFRVLTGVGRVTVRVSFVGYEDAVIMDILVGTGKEIDLVIEMKEQVVETKEVVVTAGRSRYSSLNSMATVSATTLRSADALRFAGGYYDPSRMINSFAGVSTANSDETNEVIIRGNSPRGVLWRLEGIEIPNPNHFSTGQGGSGGAYSIATSNVLSSFGFYTGAFPAEFGNALSGVMDMDLRKGNNERREYAFQTGMLGAEVSAEGPFSGKSAASYLVNARYVNFGILSSFNLIDLGMLNIPPNTSDLVCNINIPAGKAGTFNFFSLYGLSLSGRKAPHNTALWVSPSDNYEESDHEDLYLAGIKHFVSLPDNKTYLRTTLAYTYQSEIYSEGNLDSSFYRHVTYKHDYRYPALRASFSLNHKFNANHSLKTGLNYNRLYGNLLYFRLNSEDMPDTVVNSQASTYLAQAYGQWKFKASNTLEFSSGIHLMHFGLSREWSLEPRFGLRCELTDKVALIAGTGLHSRCEALSIYYAGIPGPGGYRTLKNLDLELTRSVHWVGGLEVSFSGDITLRLEAYHQSLFCVPIVNDLNSRYSVLNISQGVPENPLENKGRGRNKGMELTLEKSFTRKYYFLLTASLFNSEYFPGDRIWHPTYYNNRYIVNFLGGRDFYVGRKKQNTVGVSIKCLSRGGYRYTPVDLQRSLDEERVVTIGSESYAKSLPDFFRLDGGLSFRKNNPGNSWLIMLDIQNITDRSNVFRKRYVYSDGAVTSYYIYGLGIVPVFNFRIEFQGRATGQQN